MSPSRQSSGVDPHLALLFCLPVQSMPSLLPSKVEEISTRACLYDLVFIKTGVYIRYASIIGVSYKFNLLQTAYHLYLSITEILTITVLTMQHGLKDKSIFYFFFIALVQHTQTSNLSLLYLKTQNIDHLKQTGMERSYIRIHITVFPIIQHCFISVISWFSPQFLEIITKSLSCSLYSRSLVKDWAGEKWHMARNFSLIYMFDQGFQVSNLHLTTFGVIIQLGGTSQSVETKH